MNKFFKKSTLLFLNLYIVIHLSCSTGQPNTNNNKENIRIDSHISKSKKNIKRRPQVRITNPNQKKADSLTNKTKIITNKKNDEEKINKKDIENSKKFRVKKNCENHKIIKNSYLKINSTETQYLKGEKISKKFDGSTKLNITKKNPINKNKYKKTKINNNTTLRTEEKNINQNKISTKELDKTKNWPKNTKPVQNKDLKKDKVYEESNKSEKSGQPKLVKDESSKDINNKKNVQNCKISFSDENNLQNHQVVKNQKNTSLDSKKNYILPIKNIDSLTEDQEKADEYKEFTDNGKRVIKLLNNLPPSNPKETNHEVPSNDLPKESSFIKIQTKCQNQEIINDECINDESKETQEKPGRKETVDTIPKKDIKKVQICKKNSLNKIKIKQTKSIKELEKILIDIQIEIIKTQNVLKKKTKQKNKIKINSEKKIYKNKRRKKPKIKSKKMKILIKEIATSSSRLGQLEKTKKEILSRIKEIKHINYKNKNFLEKAFYTINLSIDNFLKKNIL